MLGSVPRAPCTLLYKTVPVAYGNGNKHVSSSRGGCWQASGHTWPMGNSCCIPALCISRPCNQPHYNFLASYTVDSAH